MTRSKRPYERRKSKRRRQVKEFREFIKSCLPPSILTEIYEFRKKADKKREFHSICTIICPAFHLKRILGKNYDVVTNQTHVFVKRIR